MEIERKILNKGLFGLVVAIMLVIIFLPSNSYAASHVISSIANQPITSQMISGNGGASNDPFTVSITVGNVRDRIYPSDIIPSSNYYVQLYKTNQYNGTPSDSMPLNPGVNHVYIKMEAYEGQIQPTFYDVTVTRKLYEDSSTDTRLAKVAGQTIGVSGGLIANPTKVTIIVDSNRSSIRLRDLEALNIEAVMELAVSNSQPWTPVTSIAIPEGLDNKTHVFVRVRSGDGAHYSHYDITVIRRGKVTAADYTYNLNPKTYNGKAQGLAITPKEGFGEVSLIYYNGSQTVPVNAGSYEVKISVSAGQYNVLTNDIVLGTYTINKADIAKSNLKIADMAWTGTQLKPTAMKLNGANTAISTYTTVNAYGANKNIGKGTITITGKGNYVGKRTLTFNIVPKGNAVSKVAVGKKQIKVTWKKVSKAQGATKYQVRYKINGTSAWKTKTYASSKSSATIKSLKKGKKYNVQVRNYKTVSGVTYYSAWSPVKTSKNVK